MPQTWKIAKPVKVTEWTAIGCTELVMELAKILDEDSTVHEMRLGPPMCARIRELGNEIKEHNNAKD